MRIQRKGGDGSLPQKKESGASAKATPKKQPFGQTMKCLAISSAIGLVACAQELPSDEDYPEPWQQSVHPDLSPTLANHQIQGCGGMWWRESKTSKCASSPALYTIHPSSRALFIAVAKASALNWKSVSRSAPGSHVAERTLTIGSLSGLE
jgi:hypothetical protein